METGRRGQGRMTENHKPDQHCAPISLTETAPSPLSIRPYVISRTQLNFLTGCVGTEAAPWFWQEHTRNHAGIGLPMRWALELSPGRLIYDRGICHEAAEWAC